MKITASRRDDILRRKGEYEAAVARNKVKTDESQRRYRAAEVEVFSIVEEAVRRQLGDKIGELRIRVESRFGSGIQVEIGNDNGGPRRGPNASLTWTWRAYLDNEGQVTKESSSWSGLEATTIAQIEDLKRCVEQLEIINKMDWEKLLDVTLPNWKDYRVTDLEDVSNRPNFEQELMEAEIEDLIGANVLVKAAEGRNYRGDVYYQILRDSGSQYTVIEVPGYGVKDVQQGGGRYATIADLVNAIGSSIRIRKANFMKMIYTPIQTIDF